MAQAHFPLPRQPENVDDVFRWARDLTLQLQKIMVGLSMGGGGFTVETYTTSSRPPASANAAPLIRVQDGGGPTSVQICAPDKNGNWDWYELTRTP